MKLPIHYDYADRSRTTVSGEAMNERRFNHLMEHTNVQLTKDEMRNGWHFCPNFDDLLCWFGMQGITKNCTCTPWTEAEIEEGA